LFPDASPSIPTQQPIKPGIAATKSKVNVVLVYSIIAAILILAIVAAFSLNKFTSVVRATSSLPDAAPPLVQSPAALQPASPVTQAPTTTAAAPPLVQAPSTAATAPPLTAAPATTAPTAPQAIIDYLAFLQKMEQSRVALENQEEAALMPLLGTAEGMKTDTDEQQKNSGLDQINQGMSDNMAKWQALIKQFQQNPPPDGCEEVGNAYYKFLQDYTDLESQIQVALANGDTAKVLQLQSAQSTVNQDANTADGALSEVCTRYNAKKLFVISADGSTSGTSLVGL
jgi:hypothetical protein